MGNEEKDKPNKAVQACGIVGAVIGIVTMLALSRTGAVPGGAIGGAIGGGVGGAVGGTVGNLLFGGSKE